MTSTYDVLAAAKLWAISEAGANVPYLATALYALVPVESRDVERMAADTQWRVYVNPTWVTNAEIGDVGRELCHLVWHLLMDHAGRARSMHVDSTNAEPWHLAAETTIAEALGTRISPNLTTLDRMETSNRIRPRSRPGQSAEQYYAMLSGLPTPAAAPTFDTTRPGCRCGSACDGAPRAHDQPPSAHVLAVRTGQAGQIRQAVAIAYQEHVSKRPGDAHAELLRWVAETTRPTLPWEVLLARAIRRTLGWTSGRQETTWARPSRRASITPGILQPAWRRPAPRVAIVIDTSGSMDNSLLSQALSEVDGALAALGVPGGDVTVLACDAAVGAVARVRKAADTNLVGGGGTDMGVGITVAASQRPRPNLIAVLTDGYTPWPDTSPGIPVIAAILGRNSKTLPPTPPWAYRVECVLR